MTNFFCADFSRQIQEDIIGSGTNYSTYVLVECPPPWTSNAFESKSVPQNLRDLIEEVEQRQPSVRFLLIAPQQLIASAIAADGANKTHTKVLIFDRKKEALVKGYKKSEFNVEAIAQVADVVRTYLAGGIPDCERETNETRDIIICTHGSHDKCCARYGNPFYRQALAAVCNLSLSHIRVWKSSHFGGHRFAPTAIDFPEGRYYGTLDRDSFESILTRTGDIKCLNRVYRGWSLLPTAIQVLERELMLRYGWDWFNYKVAGKILKQNQDESAIEAEMTLENPDGFTRTYRADLVSDESKTVELKGSCGASKESKFVKYSVENLHLYSERKPPSAKTSHPSIPPSKTGRKKTRIVLPVGGASAHRASDLTAQNMGEMPDL